VGFDLGFALYRRRVLAAEELDRLEQHLRVWRTKIIGYDWYVPREPAFHQGELVAWGLLRPTRGQAGVSDQGGYLPDVVAQVHAALINARDLIRESRIAVADGIGALAWTGNAFEYNDLAEVPALPGDSSSWVSMSASRSIPDGRAVSEAANADRRRRPTTRGAATLALANADIGTLMSLVLAPISGKISDLERTAAVERLAEEASPAACAALVQRARNDGAERKWTPVLLRGLASGRERCPWATAVLAFDRGWRGAAEALLANVTDDAIPHLERLPLARLWSALALLALDAINTNAGREAKRRLLDRVVEPLPAARLAAISAIAAAFRSVGPQLQPALEHVQATLAAYAKLGGDAQTWLSHQREAGQRALAVLRGEQVEPSTIAQGLAALAEFAVTGRDPVRLDEHHRIELLRIEGEWLVRHGHTPT
jgi:hypothetical protein